MARSPKDIIKRFEPTEKEQITALEAAIDKWMDELPQFEDLPGITITFDIPKNFHSVSSRVLNTITGLYTSKGWNVSMHIEKRPNGRRFIEFTVPTPPSGDPF